MSKIAIRTCLAGLPIAVVAIVSYAVDPANILRRRFEPDIASIVAGGGNAALPLDFDERLVQRLVIRTMRSTPTTVVLGSSRAMQIGRKTVGDDHVFNSAVTNGSTKDLLAISAIYLRRGFVPGRLFLCLDPWLLNEHNDQTRWKTLWPEYDWMSHRLDLPVPPRDRIDERIDALHLDKAAALVSPSYFQYSLKLIAERQFHLNTVRRVPPVADDWQHVVLADGTRVYPRPAQSRSAEELRQIALRYAQAKPVFGLGRFERLDSWSLEALARLVTEFDRLGTRVVIVLPPYHPVAYAVLSSSSEYRQVLAAEAAYRRLAETARVPIAGSFDPNRAGCSEAEFYDGAHPTAECIRRLLPIT